MKTLKQNPSYKIVSHDNSSWVVAKHDNETLGLCSDLTVAYQVIYKHIIESGMGCEYLTDEDFEG